MKNFNCIFAFAKVAEHLSFVGAGREMGISASAVGKSVAQLEISLGVRLVNRTTRNVSLTSEGVIFYDHCRKIIDGLEDAKALMQNIKAVPQGLLKITVPVIGYRFITPILPEFFRRYPEMELELDFNDRTIDLISEGQDVAIRGGNLTDSQFMTKRAGPISFVICASPAYLEKNGVPQTPQDLSDHSCLQFRYPNTGKLQTWALETDSKKRLRLKSIMTCNNMEAVLSAAVKGLGLAYMPDFLARDAIGKGLLVSVLEDYIIKQGDFWIVWPSSQHLTPKTRAFIDFMSEMFNRPAALEKQVDR